MAFFFMENKELGAKAEFPDEDGVEEYWTARGWVRVDTPIEEPFVPRPENTPPGDTTFVTMWHPEARATHDFPNNPEAISGAQEAGWTLDLPKDGPEDPEPTKEPQTPAQSRKSKPKTEPTGSEKGTEK